MSSSKRKFNYQVNKVVKSRTIAEINKRTGISRADIKIVMEMLFQTIQSAVARGEKVHFRGFGSFSTKKRAQKIGRNISCNTALIIEEHYVPQFTPSKTFSAKVKTNFRDVTTAAD